MNIHGYKKSRKGMIRMRDNLFQSLNLYLPHDKKASIKTTIDNLNKAIRSCNSQIKKLQIIRKDKKKKSAIKR